MKLAIVGCRDYNDKKFIFDTIMQHFEITDINLIISGGASGVDTLAEQFAITHDIELCVYKADWAKYGKAAGPIRNKLIVEKSDVVIAFWDYKSPGTKSTIVLAEKYKKKCIIIDISS